MLKRHFFSYNSNHYWQKKTHYQKQVSYRYILSMKKMENCCNSKMYVLRKQAGKWKNMTFLHFMTTVNDFALEIDTFWAKRVAKPILETRYVNDVCIYIWFIYSQIKNLRRYNIKKNDSKCAKFTKKLIRQIKSEIRLTMKYYYRNNYPSDH